MVKDKPIVVESYYPTEKQAIAHSAVEKYILYGGAVRGGKTAWLVNEAIRQSIKYSGNRGYLCCAEFSTFKKTTLETLLRFLPEEAYAPPLGDYHKTDHYIKLRNGSIIYFGGLRGDEEGVKRIKGLELGWFGIDQAEEVSENPFLWLCSRLNLVLPGLHWKGLLTANPAPGWLRDRFIEQCLPDHRFIPATLKDNPYVPASYGDELRQLYPEEMAKRLLDGAWDIEEGKNLFPYSAIRDAVNRDLPAVGDKVAGFDVAYEGKDESVFLLRQGNKILHIEAWSGEKTTYSAGRVSRLIYEYKPTVVYIDSVGIGVGVVDPLEVQNYPIQAVNVGEKALDHELYANKRAELFNLLAKKFREGEIDIPDDSKLTSQLASIKYDYNVRNQMLIMSKEQMKRHGFKSPDYADALMLSFAGGYDDKSSGGNLIRVKYWG